MEIVASEYSHAGNCASEDSHTENKIRVVEKSVGGNEIQSEEENVPPPESESEEEGRLFKGYLYKLANDILVKIFTNGTILYNMEVTWTGWGKKIHGYPAFWKNACYRIGLNETTISESLRKQLDSAETKESVSKLWRTVWIIYRRKLCEQCYCVSKLYSRLLGMVLCEKCRDLEPYIGITKTNARNFLGLETKKVQKVIEENNITLRVHRYKRKNPPPEFQLEKPQLVTIYHFAQLAKIIKMAYPKRGLDKIKKARDSLGIKEMEVEIEEL